MHLPAYLLSAALCLSTGTSMVAAQSSNTTADFVNKQAINSLRLLLANTLPNGAIKASPSTSNPDYAYHWVRDAATVMNSVEVSQDTYKLFWTWAAFETKLQSTQNPSSPDFTIGEPKFNLDGSAFTRDWGRPQNDGPAIRVLTLVRFAQKYLEQGGSIDEVKRQLYRSEFPATSVIKQDLEYITRVWDKTSVELWEEVRGDHYHTRMVQAAALFAGARFARQMNDPGAADWYVKKGQEVYNSLTRSFWNSQYIPASINVVYGPSAKKSFLDSSVVLASLQVREAFALAQPNVGGATIHAFDGPEVLLTALETAARFKQLYAINKRDDLAPGIGRYTEDVYDGVTTNGAGNAWFLATLGYAELTYAVAGKWCSAGAVSSGPSDLLDKAVSWIQQDGFMGRRPSSTTAGSSQLSCAKNADQFKSLIGKLTYAADKYIARVQTHVPQKDEGYGKGIGSMSEQFNRDSGFMQGAVELTWSHASFLTMNRARKAALDACSRVCA
ncbi:Glucoamylase, intracellular sporulation-specific [Chytriomyces hyalinus]|nr:Glucoamylase, intracellular sporulation-specific [Chytriomyces hyalinus]